MHVARCPRPIAALPANAEPNGSRLLHSIVFTQFRAGADTEDAYWIDAGRSDEHLIA